MTLTVPATKSTSTGFSASASLMRSPVPNSVAINAAFRNPDDDRFPHAVIS
jgi:hypothetical protein